MVMIDNDTQVNRTISGIVRMVYAALRSGGLPWAHHGIAGWFR